MSDCFKTIVGWFEERIYVGGLFGLDMWEIEIHVVLKRVQHDTSLATDR